MPAVAPRRWTAAEVQALPDDPSHRVECVDGELFMTLSPRFLHQRAVTELAALLNHALRASRSGVAVVAPSDWQLDPHTLVQPDVYVVPLIDGHPPRTDDERGAPLLFVEVLSPRTARADRVVKRHRYQRAGIEYWIVDLDARLLERWLPGEERPTVHADLVSWQAVASAALVEIDLAAFFRELLGPA